MTIEKIAELCDHAGARVTEADYRHQLRPLLFGGAIAMDRIFMAKEEPVSGPDAAPAGSDAPIVAAVSRQVVWGRLLGQSSETKRSAETCNTELVSDQTLPPGSPAGPPPYVPTQGYAPPQQPHPGFPQGRPGYAPPGYPPPPAYVPPQLSPAGQPLAPFGDRLLAYLIDAAIAFVVTLVVFGSEVIAVVVWVAPAATSVPPDGTAGPRSAENLRLVPLYAAAILLMLLFLYSHHVEWVLRRSGQTVGKRVMKLRVAPLDPGAALTRGMLVKRLAVTVGCAWVPGLFYLDGLWQLWDKPYQQCLHDKWPATVVVEVPQ